MIEMKQSTEITLAQSFEKFITNCKIKNLADDTISYYKEKFNLFYKYLLLSYEEPINTNVLTKTIVSEYILYMKSKHLKDTTINTRLRAIRSIVNFLIEEEELKYFKVNLISVTEENKKPYSNEDIEKLIKRPDKKKCTFAEFRTWALECFFVATGIRSRSARNIKIQDLDFQNELIYIDTIKNRKATIIPMSNYLKKVLLEYLAIRKGKKEDYLFCNLEGEQLSRYALYHIVKKYNKQRNVKDTSVHLFRHYYAKSYIQNGGECLKLQKLLAHSNLEMTKKYVNLYGTDLQKGYNEINPLDVLAGNKQRISMKR